jgi:hypothetical protein
MKHLGRTSRQLWGLIPAPACPTDALQGSQGAVAIKRVIGYGSHRPTAPRPLQGRSRAMLAFLWSQDTGPEGKGTP